MTVFDMVTNPPAHLVPQAVAVSRQYFTIDTATTDDVMDWFAFNRHIVTYALHEGRVLGLFNIVPLTMECGQLFEREALKEEDMKVEHILPHESLKHAQYAYIAAIAVDRTENYISRQCSAALISCAADLFLNGYGPGLKKIFANPTTFQGHKLVNRLGLTPVNAYKKGLTENDIYASELNDDSRANLAYLSQRYARFVGDNPWKAGA